MCRSHSHCCLFRTVGIRTSGFALVSFALLSFALLSGYPRVQVCSVPKFLLFQIENLENSKSFLLKIMKKQLHIISGIRSIIRDPDVDCHLLSFNRLLIVFCQISLTNGE